MAGRNDLCLCGFTAKFKKCHQIGTGRPPGSGRPPSGQGRRHTGKFTKLVNLRVLLAFKDKAVYGRVGDAPLFA